MFRCVCYTCEVRNVYDEWEDAQAVFNDHARDRHEVVLERDGPAEGAVTEPTGSQTAANSDSSGRNPTGG